MLWYAELFKPAGMIEDLNGTNTLELHFI
jgi:hypothetical protein